MPLPRRYLIVRVAYVAIVLVSTLMRLEFSPDLAAASDRLIRAFMPRMVWSDAIDALRNLTLFAGFGTVWVITSGAPRLSSAIREATLAGFILSALVEGLQVFSPVRTAGILDIITNGGGALLGAAGTAFLIAAVHSAKGKRSYVGIPTLLLAGSYGIAVFCEAITPLFRSEAMPGVRGGPFTRLRLMLGLADLWQWDFPWTDFVLYAPAGFLAVMLLVEYGRDIASAWWRVAVTGALLALLLEPAHGMLGIQVRWDAAVTHAIALVLGAWAARVALPRLTQSLRGAARSGAFLLGLGVLLVLWAWRPFELRTDGAAIRAQLVLSQFTPMQSLAVRADVFSALHVAQQFFLYLGLGSLLAVWPLKLRGPLSGIKPALLFALVVELGHVFVEERLFDITNALLAWAGLVVGSIIVRRSGFTPYGEVLSSRPSKP